jgi:hypothetical protein
MSGYRGYMKDEKLTAFDEQSRGLVGEASKKIKKQKGASAAPPPVIPLTAEHVGYRVLIVSSYDQNADQYEEVLIVEFSPSERACKFQYLTHSPPTYQYGWCDPTKYFIWEILDKPMKQVN